MPACRGHSGRLELQVWRHSTASIEDLLQVSGRQEPVAQETIEEETGGKITLPDCRTAGRMAGLIVTALGIAMVAAIVLVRKKRSA